MNEQDTPLSPDDPRLTAYAFGELEESERKAVEAAVQRDPALQAAVRDLRALGGNLASALAQEPLPAPVKARPRPATVRSEFDPPRGARLLRFPGLYYVMTGTAAAGFALLVALRDPDAGKSTKETVRRYEVVLTPPTESGSRSSGTSQASEASKHTGTAGDGASRMAGSRAADPSYRNREDNAFLPVVEAPVSSFAVEVGTEAYADVRRLLQAGKAPPPELVRIEELVNYFPYRYSAPAAEAVVPIAAHLEVASAPWSSRHRLVRIGLQGRELAEGASTTLATDVRFEVEFNPARVARYRLIGYENRSLDRDEARSGSAADGVIEAGYRVTALYEVVPVGEDLREDGSPKVDPLKYTRPGGAGVDPGVAEELLTVKVRYKEPDSDLAQRVAFALVDGGATFEAASSDFQFAAAVAGFGMVLRDSPHRGSASLLAVGQWAERNASFDPGGRRAEFIELIRRAEALVR